MQEIFKYNGKIYLREDNTGKLHWHWLYYDEKDNLQKSTLTYNDPKLETIYQRTQKLKRILHE